MLILNENNYLCGHQTENSISRMDINNRQKELALQTKECANKSKSLHNNDLLQTQNECREIEPLLSFLDIEYTQIRRRHGLPIDFELSCGDRNIAIEVTDVRPYLERYKIAKKATENVVEEVIKNMIIGDTISYFQIDIILKEKTYYTKRLKTNFEFQQEVHKFLQNGDCENPQYIKSFSKSEYSDVNIPKNKLAFNFQYEGFLARVSPQCIYKAIEKKENKLRDYKTLYGESFDEYWLCIGLPVEEQGYSIGGISLEFDFMSDYQRIYITQQLPPKTILLYSK